MSDNSPQVPNDDWGNVNVMTRNKTEEKLKKPSMYTLVFFNDDFTPMAFVVYVLQRFCNLSVDDATREMMKIHKEGKAKVGRYTLEIAEQKTLSIVGAARQQEYPLLVQVEEVE